MNIYPVLPLRNTVLFPNQIIPIYIGRKQSLNLIDSVTKLDDKKIIVVAQKDGKVELPKKEDFYQVGTLATVMKVFDMPDNSKSAIVKGIRRVNIDKYSHIDSYFKAEYSDFFCFKEILFEDLTRFLRALPVPTCCFTVCFTTILGLDFSYLA